jgi:hypothetical protein
MCVPGVGTMCVPGGGHDVCAGDHDVCVPVITRDVCAGGWHGTKSVKFDELFESTYVLPGVRSTKLVRPHVHIPMSCVL